MSKTILALLYLAHFVSSYSGPWSALLSGTDIRGAFADNESDNNNAKFLTPAASYSIGRALGGMIIKDCDCKGGGEVVIGRDTRTHGGVLVQAMARGIASMGLKVSDCGIATTPSIFYGCSSERFDAGVMCTASHLPKHMAGFKFFVKDDQYGARGLEKGQVMGLLEAAEGLHEQGGDEGGPSSAEGKSEEGAAIDLVGRYKSHVVATFRRRTSLDAPFSDLKVLLSTGSGSGYIVGDVLSDLGAKLSTLDAAPDGNFPNGTPNPESKSMVDRTLKRCREVDADVAVLLDTDGDRCGIIVKTSKGYEIINRNRLIALVSSVACRGNGGGETCEIVTDSVTSLGLEKFIEAKGGKQVRFMKGYLNVINEAKRRTAEGKVVPLAMETSGHGAFECNGYSDDGSFTALVVLEEIVRSGGADECLKGFEDAGFEEELRMKVKAGFAVKGIYEKIAEAVTQGTEILQDWTFDIDNKEGVRVTFEGGFFMVRPSLHDPVISVQVEARSDDEAKALVAKLVKLFMAPFEGRGFLPFDMSELEGVVEGSSEPRGWQ